MSGVPYHAWTHLPKEQGGTDPVLISGGDAVCYLDSWNYLTSNTIPTTTWRAVANSTNVSFFEDAWVTPDTGLTYDFDTGIITMNDDAAYQITGWVQWNEDFENGEERIIALNFGASFRVINVYNLDAAHGTIGQHPLFVASPCIVGFGSASVYLDVWHNATASRSIRDASLMVERSALVADMTYTARP